MPNSTSKNKCDGCGAENRDLQSPPSLTKESRVALALRGIDSPEFCSQCFVSELSKFPDDELAGMLWDILSDLKLTEDRLADSQAACEDGGRALEELKQKLDSIRDIV